MVASESVHLLPDIRRHGFRRSQSRSDTPPVPTAIDSALHQARKPLVGEAAAEAWGDHRILDHSLLCRDLDIPIDCRGRGRKHAFQSQKLASALQLGQRGLFHQVILGVGYL